MASSWKLPVKQNKADGSARRVGIEIELLGIDIEEMASVAADSLGGEVARVSAVEYNVDVPSRGSFRVEVDFAWLKEYARQQEIDAAKDRDSLNVLAVELLGSASALVVPCEIVTPPIPMPEMAEPLDALVENLRAAGGKGTRQSVLYAFGVHLNVEPPDLEAPTVLAYLRAFVCLYDWIVDEGQIDLSRQISPYIKRFERDYELLIADPDYDPDWPTLIDDYLRYMPSRDHALDMLPMFAHVDEARVSAAIDDPLVNARPAFHYRLANSCVDEEHWSIAHPWNRWVQIEQLAGRPNALSECLTAFAKDRQRVLRGVDKRWIREVRQWLLD